MSSNVNNEQPMSKRQKIDADNKKGAFNVISNGTDTNSDSNTPPDILPMTKHDHKCTTNGSPHRNDSSKTISSTEVRRSSSESPSDELDNAAACNVIKSIEHKINLPTENGSHCIAEFPDLLKTSLDVASTSRSQEVASTTAPGCSNRNSSTNIYETSSRLSSRDNNTFSRLNNVDEFQLFLMKQCLCDIDEQSLRRPFATHYYTDMNGLKYNVPLKEWPAHQLIQFLSNIELLFEVYLNQNAKGEICTRVMQVCDALLLKDEIINGIFELDEYNNKFVQYLAIKVLANCLLIAKDKETYCEDLLTTLMSNLVIHHEPTDHRALGKVSFILGIILHIMEWKDIKKHPLDDQIVINGREVYNDSDNESSYSLPVSTPSNIQDNYFARHHGDDEIETPLAPTPPAEPQLRIGDHHNREYDRQSSTSQGSTDPRNFSCHLQYLSDSESFDSNNLKVSILVKLQRKWSYLVQNMAKCISLLHANRNLHYIENTVATFLTLWERIISVDTCIEYDSTLPFHKYLTIFTEILIEGLLPIQIYKQLLTLFSASLCYTTTLALQPEVPQETNELATKLFSKVRENRKSIFTSLPTHEIETQNNISFIGYKNTTIIYEVSSDLLSVQNDETSDDDSDHESDIDLELDEHFNKSIDSTLLQKLVLLVLKAIAVTVRPIGGGDSSDSSMDSVSSNNSSVETTEPDWIFIENATRDAIEKLQIFLRNKLQFHPETHLSKVIVHLFSDQDDYLLEAMLCLLGCTIAFLPRQPPFGNAANRQANNASNDRPQFRMLIEMISPVYTFLEFLELIEYNKKETMLDFLLTDETCFLLYFLRFLKYIRSDWGMFQSQCNKWQSTSNAMRANTHSDKQPYKRVMDVLISLRLQLDRLVFRKIFPYEISPLLLLMRQCESLYEGNYGLF